MSTLTTNYEEAKTYCENEIEQSEKSTEETKSHISDEESSKESSTFGDKDCGEPMSAQRLVLDFTPVNDIDTDDIQLKCCMFWDFVNSQRDLDDLIVKAKLEPSTNKTLKTNDMTSIPRDLSIMSMNLREKTAVSILEFVEEKGLIRRAFESRLPTSYCNEELKDYSDAQKSFDLANSAGEEMHHFKQKNQIKNKKIPTRSVAANKMCKTLHEWDIEHPKSMSPPQPAPVLDEDLSNKITAKNETQKLITKILYNHL